MQGKYYFYQGNKESEAAFNRTIRKYQKQQTDKITDSNYVFTYGGDGSMIGVLQQLWREQNRLKPADRWPVQVTGIHYGGERSKGFLMNPPINDETFSLPQLVESSEIVTFYPLEATMTDVYGNTFRRIAFNDVVAEKDSSMNQACAVEVTVTDQKGNTLVQGITTGNGLIVCTPAGSYGYNYNAHGQRIKITESKIGIHPICDRPSEGTLSNHFGDDCTVKLRALNPMKRPIIAFTDNNLGLGEIKECTIRMNKEIGIPVHLGQQNPLMMMQHRRMCRLLD